MAFVSTTKLIPEASDADLFDTILTADGKGAKFKEAVLAEILRRATLDDGKLYFYTYAHPLTHRTVLDFWRVDTLEECKTLARAKYNSDSYFLEETKRADWMASTMAKKFAALPRAS